MGGIKNILPQLLASLKLADNRLMGHHHHFTLQKKSQTNLQRKKESPRYATAIKKKM